MGPPPLQLTLDQAFSHIGEFGKSQRRVVVLSGLFGLPNGILFLLWVFLSIDPVKNRAWRCLDSADTACTAVWESPSQSTFCALPSTSWEWTSVDSVVAQFNLICSDGWKVQFTNSLMFIGCFIGSGLFGALADRFGRRLPLFAATALSAAATLVSTAATNYWFIAAARLVVGVGAAGMVQGVYLVITEVTGPTFRGVASVLPTIFFCVGEFLLVAIAYLAPNWHSISFACGALSGALVLLYPLIPESARWLLSQGKHEKATTLLRSMSKTNGHQIPDGLVLVHSSDMRRLCPEAAPSSSRSSGSSSSDLQALEDGNASARARASSNSICNSNPAKIGEAAAAGAATGASDSDVPQQELPGFLQQLRHPLVAVMSLVLLLTWFTNFFSYYGISLGLGGLPGSIYATFTMNTTGELVAYLLAAALIDRVGRHNLVSLGLLLGGAACIACAFATGQVAQVVLAAFGKCGMCCSLSVTPTYTAELYPTHTRSRALGIFSQACRIGSIAAPFVLLLGAQSGIRSPVFIPYIAMGSLALLAGSLVLLMPETRGLCMIETVEDLQQLQTIFTAKPWHNGCWATVVFLFRTREAAATAAAAGAAAGLQQQELASSDLAAICGEAGAAAAQPSKAATAKPLAVGEERC